MGHCTIPKVTIKEMANPIYLKVVQRDIVFSNAIIPLADPQHNFPVPFRHKLPYVYNTSKIEQFDLDNAIPYIEN